MRPNIRGALILLCALAMGMAASEASDEEGFRDRLTERGSGFAARPEPMRFPLEALTALPKYDATTGDPWQLTLFWSDLRGLDLHDRLPDLMQSSFSTLTEWPDSLPSGFDPVRIMEIGRNPGLGVRALHAKGITGRGVSVAVIDQPIIVDHAEYADRLRLYEEIHVLPGTADLHGPATASIAVGKTMGVAPEADLYFIAYRPWTGRPHESENMALTFIPVAQAIERILEVNRGLPKEHRIRVISLSIGWQRSQEGYAEVMKAVQHATDEGVFVLSSSLSETHGLQYHGLAREPLKDPDDPASYSLITAWGPDLSKPTLLIPMDSRTTAAPTGDGDYIFYRHGGWSWVTPYLAGLYALACQVKPDITPDLFWKTALETGSPIDPASQPSVSRETMEKQAAVQVDRVLANAKTPEGMKTAKEQLANAYQQIMGKPAPEVSDDKLREWAIGWVTDYMVKTRSSTGESRIVNPAKLMETLQAGAK
jgi:hypothetical protein